jgi:Glyoxalase/Bleomycin resistance protein/Dioxygenase superfamily
MPLPIVQVAYHVPDPQAAALRYAREFGWGPFFLFEHIPLTRSLHRGAARPFDHTSAYGQAGDLMVELISQHDDEPSVLRDMYSRHQTGLHHVAMFVDSLEVALANDRALGREVALEATTQDGTEFAMVDRRADLGHMIEYYEPRAGLAKFYAYVKRKSVGWDGADPLRRLAP